MSLTVAIQSLLLLMRFLLVVLHEFLLLPGGTLLCLPLFLRLTCYQIHDIMSVETFVAIILTLYTTVVKEVMNENW